MDVLTRRWTPVETEDGILLDAVRPDPEGAGAICFFKTGLASEAVESSADFSVSVVRQIGGALAVHGQTGPDAAFDLPLAGMPMDITPEPPETDLFAGLNTALVITGAEWPGTLRDWLDYHARTQNLQAALIVDRAPPDAPSGLAEALRAAPVPGIERVVVLDPGLPLGKEGLGDEAHRFNAPDAPGKDRMERPAPDPWRAPLGEVLIYEALRYRFLDRARAVLNLDASDLLLPPKGQDVFTLAVNATGGVVALVGTRIFPWGLRKDAAPTFGDHICRRFDAGAGNPRWCVAPGRAGAASVWRLVRVVGTPGPAAGPLPYLRCMALRHPAEAVGAIVPKTSLVEEETLIALMGEHFGGKPVRAPEEELKPAAVRDSNLTGIVTTMKNEGPFILEWLAHHRAIGVEKFLVYTNDCTDGTDTMLELLQARGLVEHRDNPFRDTGLKPQHAALQAAEDEPLVKALDWVICMDVDEFINIHAGKGRLEDLYDAVGDANLISMNWRLFGNADVHDYQDRFITEQFTRCAPEFIRKPHQAWGFKTLVRQVGLFKKLGVHRPKGLKPQLVDEVRWVNGSGRRLPQTMYRNAWRSGPSTYGYDLVTLNHYAVRSAESFLVKRDRGRVNHVDRDQGAAYWFRMNNNAEEDRSILRRLDATRAEFDRLMADPEIAAAHQASVTAHRARVAELKERPDYLALYDELTGSRMQRLSRMHGHFGAGVFLAGPDVVPQDVVEADLTPDFFFTVDRAEQAH